MIDIDSTIRSDALMFGESQSRIVVSFAEKDRAELESLAQKANVEFDVIGTVGGEDLAIHISGKEFIKQNINELKNIWEVSLERYGRQIT